MQPGPMNGTASLLALGISTGEAELALPYLGDNWVSEVQL